MLHTRLSCNSLAANLSNDADRLENGGYTGFKIGTPHLHCVLWAKYDSSEKLFTVCCGAAHKVLHICAQDHAIAIDFIRGLTVTKQETVYTFENIQFTRHTWQFVEPLPIVALPQVSTEQITLPDIPEMYFDDNFMIDRISYPPTPFPQLWNLAEYDTEPVAPGVMWMDEHDNE